jgi:hypothetical protein
MPAPTRTTRQFAVALGIAMVAIAGPARAQDATLAPTVTSAPASAPASEPTASQPVATAATGPTIDAAAVGVRHVQAAATTAPARRAGYGQPMALMIVGGAAVLVGLIIGGDVGTVIAVGGAVTGLIGLYQYLQ